MRAIKTIEDFQEYVWQGLPMRKHALGREGVYDAVAVVIQEWPDEALCQSRSGDTGEVIATEELIKTAKRHLALTYGEQKFGMLWLLALQILLPIIVDQILRWWRRRKEHQGKLRIWRRKWVNNGNA